ncbi:MAG: DUF2191 domain-containing protein [Fulvivirga sp.]
MKVTALIPDDLLARVKKSTGGKNITESIIIALNAYLDSKNIEYLLDSVEKKPLEFNEDFEAYGIRKINRNR